MATQTINRPKKSVALTEKEHESLKKFLSGKTWFEASKQADISRETLYRIVTFGSGAEKTINKLIAKGII